MRQFLRLSRIALAVALIVMPGLARAQVHTPAAHADDRWYGWQILLADTGALATTTASMLATDDGLGLAGFGLVAYPLGSPIIHCVHGKPLVGLADFVARAVLPIAGAVAGGAVGARYTKTEGDEAMPQTRVGALLGYDITAAALTALDVAAFSFAPKASNADEQPRDRDDGADDNEADTPRIDIHPAVEVTRARISLSVTGRF